MSRRKILGIGGIFFKAKDPQTLCRWYRDCLGMALEDDFDGGLFQPGDLPASAYNIWSAFPGDTDYFGITVATLDEDPGSRPRYEIWTSSKAPWLRHGKNFLSHLTEPDGEDAQ